MFCVLDFCFLEVKPWETRDVWSQIEGNEDLITFSDTNEGDFKENVNRK